MNARFEIRSVWSTTPLHSFLGFGVFRNAIKTYELYPKLNPFSIQTFFWPIGL